MIAEHLRYAWPILLVTVLNCGATITTNDLQDAGFEALSGNQPDPASIPWFTQGDDDVWSVVPSADEAHNGSQSVVFQYYYDAASVVQNTGIQVDTNAMYGASVWMLKGEQSFNPSHINDPKLNIELYTSPTPTGTYTYRQTMAANLENSAPGVWEEFTGYFYGFTLRDEAGEYIQIRYTRTTENATHRIHLDDAAFGEATIPPYVDSDLFDLSGSDYQLIISDGGAQLVGTGSNTVLEISAAANHAALIRLRPPTGTYWDLTDDAFISLDVENMESDEVHFRVDTRSDYPYTVDIERGRGDLMHLGWLDPAETRQFNCFLVRDSRIANSLPDLSEFEDMRGKPDKLTLLGWMGLDAASIDEITIHLPQSEQARTIRVYRIFRHLPAVAEELRHAPGGFYPFIDRYGQYNRTEWPGKTLTDQDLLDAKAAEDIDLAANPPPASFNLYGGFEDGPDCGATGHFRTQKINGRWWVIDPLGKQFWSFGVNSAGSMTTGPTWQKWHFFEWLPDDDPQTVQFLDAQDNYKVGALNAWRKYGTDYADEYNTRALERIRSWGLNTLGGWQAIDTGQASSNKVPYTITVWHPEARLNGNEKIINPYNPAFRTAVRDRLAEFPDTWDDPFCVGYYVDNELHWGVPTLFDAGMTDDSDTSAQDAFIAYLQTVYPTIGDLNAAWGTGLGSFSDVGNMDPITIRAIAMSDVNPFYDEWVDTYFRIVDEEIAAVAPNKLYLGCRWHQWNNRMVPIAANYVDIFSFNLYRKEILNHDYYGVDVPFISTEYNFGSVDRGKFFPGLGWSSDQRNRGEQMKYYVRSAIDNPLCVGAHWFAWMNSPTWGRGDGENAGMGFVDVVDTPYPVMRDTAREIATNLYALLMAAEEPTSGLLVGWDHTAGANVVDHAAPGFEGSIFVDQQPGPGAGDSYLQLGSNDGTFGTVTGANLTVGNVFWVRQGNNPSNTHNDIVFEIVNNSGFEAQLNSINFDYARFWPNSPQKVILTCESGDLNVADGTEINSVDGLPEAGWPKFQNYDDFEWSLTNLADHVLADGESATFKLVAANYTDMWSDGVFDNIGIFGEFMVQPPYARFVAIEASAADQARLTVYATGALDRYSLQGRSRLDSGNWTAVPHSNDDISAYVTTNLSHSTADGSNIVIYVETSEAAKFFGVQH